MIENKFLTAQVSFTDVDGKYIQKEYVGSDVNGLLDRIGYAITDEYNFPETKNQLYPGINGTIDISKPLKIVMCLK